MFVSREVGVLGEVIGEAARRFGDTPCYVAEAGWSLSYADVDRLSGEAAAGLRRRGVGEGDVVALALPAIAEYFVAYLAVAKVGALTAGVNARLSTRERDSVLAVAEPRLTLATADLAPRSEEVVEVVPANSPEDVLGGLRAAGR